MIALLLTKINFSLVAISLLITHQVITSPGPLPPQIEGDQSISAENISYAGCGNQVAPIINANYENSVIELVNHERANYALPPLKSTIGLENAARYHAADMAQDNYFYHDTYDRVDGGLLRICSSWERIATYIAGASGENIAAGYSDPQAVMNAWLNSPGHRSNILSEYSWEIGVGYYQGSGSYGRYWVQDFGKRNGIYPLIINNEAAVTDNSQIELFIYGTWDEIRLRNNDDAWSDWFTFSNEIDWQLPNRAGQHLVQAEVRAGEISTVSSDTIYLSGEFLIPELGNLPTQLSFFYDLNQHKFYPENIVLTPKNVGDEQPLLWGTTMDGNWFSVSPVQGLTPTPLQIELISPTSTSATQTGSISIIIDSPDGVLGSPHDIVLYLYILDGPPTQLYLPLIAAAE
jgi:uncharacterized protein YkwD